MTGHFAIRPVENTASDLDQLNRFCHELAEYDGHTAHATPEKLRAGLFSGSNSVHAFFGERLARPIGFILAYESFTVYHGERGLYVPGAYVIHEFRQLGYGAKLMRYIAAYAVEHDFKFLNWIVETNNANAGAIYAKAGADVSEGWSYCRIAGDKLEQLARLAPSPSGRR